MSDMCRIQVTGNLAADPEERETPSGKTCVGFRIAVNRWLRSKRQEGTQWYDVNVWAAGFGEYVLRYAQKGSKIFIYGEPDEPRLHQGKVYLGITVGFSGGGHVLSNVRRSEEEFSQLTGVVESTETTTEVDTDDDVPF